MSYMTKNQEIWDEMSGGGKVRVIICFLPYVGINVKLKNFPELMYLNYHS